MLTNTEEHKFLQILKDLDLSVRDQSSLDNFFQLGIPALKNEEYKHSPIDKVLKQLDTDQLEIGADSDQGVEKLLTDAYTIHFLNGKLVSLPKDLQKGLEISQVEHSSHELNHASLNDPFQLLNKGAFTSAVKITVDKNIKVEKDIEVVHTLTSSSSSLSMPRIEVEVADHSELSIIEHYKFNNQSNCLLFPVWTSLVGRNARLKTLNLQTEAGNQIQVCNQYIHQSRDSYYKNITVSTSGKFIRNNHNVIQSDENCESHLYGITLTKGKDHIDHHTIVDHTKPNCYSNELYKGVFDENSTGVFNGRIYVRPNAQKTNAFQSNGNILLSETATIHTKPQLEIWADDVKCSHGCTSGQLDEEALFYLQSRGLSMHQAKSLLLNAFLGEVIEEIEQDSIRDYISEHVSQRLS